jgi:hypothetical protein
MFIILLDLCYPERLHGKILNLFFIVDVHSELISKLKIFIGVNNHSSDLWSIKKRFQLLRAL